MGWTPGACGSRGVDPSRVRRGRRVSGRGCAASLGRIQPLQLVVFGRLLDSFNDLDKDEAIEKINFFAACYAVLGVQQMITQSLQSACLAASAARQSRRIRSLYFSSLARQPMSFADANDCGALASGVLEATTVMAVGMGDELAKVGQTLLAFFIGLSVALALSWRLAVRRASPLPRRALLCLPAPHSSPRALLRASCSPLRASRSWASSSPSPTRPTPARRATPEA